MTLTRPRLADHWHPALSNCCHASPRERPRHDTNTLESIIIFVHDQSVKKYNKGSTDQKGVRY